MRIGRWRKKEHRSREIPEWQSVPLGGLPHHLDRVGHKGLLSLIRPSHAFDVDLSFIDGLGQREPNKRPDFRIVNLFGGLLLYLPCQLVDHGGP